MTANFMNIFGMTGTLAKGKADARAARIACLVQAGYRHWLDGVAAGVECNNRFVGGLTSVGNAADLAALHHEWMTRTQALATEQWQTFMDLSSKLSSELGLPALPADALSPTEAPPVKAVPAAVPIPVPRAEEASVAPLTVPEVPKAVSPEAEPPKAAEAKPVVAKAPETAPQPVAKADAPKAPKPAPKKTEAAASAAPAAGKAAPARAAAPAKVEPSKVEPPKAEPSKAAGPKAAEPPPPAAKPVTSRSAAAKSGNTTPKTSTPPAK